MQRAELAFFSTPEDFRQLLPLWLGDKRHAPAFCHFLHRNLNCAETDGVADPAELRMTEMIPRERAACRLVLLA